MSPGEKTEGEKPGRAIEKKERSRLSYELSR